MRDLRRPAKGVKMQRALSAGLVASLLLTACGGAPTPAAPPAASATPAPVKVSASYSNVIASNLPLWVAKEAGIFARHGLDVELTLVESSKGIPALLTGDVKFAHIGGSEVVSAAAGGADLVIVGGTVPVWPYVLIVAPDIKKPEDLKGKKLARISRFTGHSRSKVGLRETIRLWSDLRGLRPRQAQWINPRYQVTTRSMVSNQLVNPILKCRHPDGDSPVCTWGSREVLRNR